MRAHQGDLRDEVAQELREQHEAGRELPPALDAELRARAAAFAADLAAQGSEAAPGRRLRALLQYAERLTLTPGRIEASHVQDLRDVGLDDRAVHDAAQVVAYFNYINRVADGLGVDLEPEMTPGG